MDFLMFGMIFAIGFVFSRIVFGGTKSGPFEESLMLNLRNGKKVTVTIDEECYIFEMYGNRMRITKGIATFEETPYVMDSDNLINVNFNKPDDPGGA